MESSRSYFGWHYAIVLCGALVLYVISCSPSMLWQDSGLVQYRVWNNDIEGFMGLATSHPLFYILAIGVKYMPLGEFPYRINLISAIAAGFAVANMFLFVRLLLGKNLPAVVAAITLAISHTFWLHASMIETYTLWSALFLAELIMLLQYTRTYRVLYLYGLGFISGLSISVHMLASISLVCYVIYIAFLMVKNKIKLCDVGIFVLLCFIGALPYEYLIAKNIIQTGDITGALASSAFGLRWQGAVLNTSLSLRTLKENILYIFLNFPTPNILLFPIGCLTLFKAPIHKGMRNILLGLIVLFFVFAFRYTVPDRYSFFIPFYCVASIFIGLGAYFILERIKSHALTITVLLLCLIPVGVYAVAPILVEKMQINIGTRGDVPYRNDAKYFLQPWKTGYTGADRFAAEALKDVEGNAVIYADITTVVPLLLTQQMKGKHPDVAIVSGAFNSENAPKFDAKSLDQLLEKRPIYVVSRKPGYCPEFMLDNYKFTRKGILWKIGQSQK